MTWAEVACPSGSISSSMIVSGSMRLSSMQHQHPILQAATQLQMKTPKAKIPHCLSNKIWNSGYSKWSYRGEKHLQQSTFPIGTNYSSQMTKLIHKQSSSLHIMIDIFQLNSQFTSWRIQTLSNTHQGRVSNVKSFENGTILHASSSNTKSWTNYTADRAPYTVPYIDRWNIPTLNYLNQKRSCWSVPV